MPYDDVSEVRDGLKEWEGRLAKAKKRKESDSSDAIEIAAAEREIDRIKSTLEDLQKIVDEVNDYGKGKGNLTIDSFYTNFLKLMYNTEASENKIDKKVEEAEVQLKSTLKNEVGVFWAILSTIAEVFRRAFSACQEIFRAVDVERGRELLKNSKPIELFAVSKKRMSATGLSKLRACVNRDKGFDSYIEGLAEEHFAVKGPSAGEKREWYTARLAHYRNNVERYKSERAAIKAFAEVESRGGAATNTLDVEGGGSLLADGFRNREQFDLPFVAENFIALYAMAEGGTPSEKKLLAEILVERVCYSKEDRKELIIFNEEVTIENSLPHFLLRVIDEPADYPSIEMLLGLAEGQAEQKILDEIGIKRLGRAALDEAYFDKEELERLFNEDSRFSEKRQEAVSSKVGEYNDYRWEIDHGEYCFVERSSKEERKSFFAKKIATAALHGGLLAEKSDDLVRFYEGCRDSNIAFLVEKLGIGKNEAEELLRSFGEFLQHEGKIVEKNGDVEIITPEIVAKFLTVSDKELREAGGASKEVLRLRRAETLVKNLGHLFSMADSRAKEFIARVGDEKLLIDLYNRESMLEKLEGRIAAEEFSREMIKSHFLVHAETMTSEKFRLRHISEGRRIDEAWLREMVLKNGVVEVCEELGLSEKGAEALLVMMAESLVVGTRISHLRLACRLLEQNRPESEVYKTLQSLKRSYNLFESSDVDFSKLFFELYKQYNLRGDQMAKIAEMVDSKGGKEVVVEAPTGFGKTDAVAPLAARMVAEKGKLAILCWPAALVKENASELGRSFSGAFGTKAAAMNFERNSSLHSETLKLIYEDLVACKKKGVPVNLTADALKSFMLHYRTLLDELYEKKDSKDSAAVGELEKQAEYFAKTLKLLKEESVILIDESHDTLHPKDRMIYSIGEEEKLSKDLLKTFDKVMGKFFSIEIGGEKIEKLLAQREALVIKANKKEIVEKAVELLLKELPFMDDEQERVKRFIVEGKPNPFVGKERIKAHDEAIEEVCLYKGLFGDGIFTECLEMSHNEHYGLSQKHLFGKGAEGSGEGGGKRCSFAIPYSSAQTPTETENGPSQYANHHKTMLLTYLNYFTRGLYGEGEDRESYQVYHLMKELLVQATLESDREKVRNPNFTIKETKAYRFFREHAPEELKDKLTPKGVKNLSEEQVKAMHEAMKENREVILRFIKDVALQDINTYPETVDCTFANFLSMFDKKVMLSATPMDPASYRIDASFLSSKNTANRALEKMMLHSLDDEIVTIPGGGSEAVLCQIDGVIQDTDDCCALIDLAGLFKDVTNEEVAKALNRSSLDEGEIEQVTYYDAKRGFVKIKRDSDVAVKDDVKVLEKRFVYFDQPRAVGSDIKLKEEGVAVVLVTPDIPFTKVAQAIGRMRKLGMDQKVRFVVPEHMLGAKKSVTKKELIAHWEAELVREEEARNTMSLQQQLDDLLQAALQKTMIGKSPAQMAKFYRKNRSFFVTKVDISAKALYGSDTVEKRGVDMLLAHVKEKKMQLHKLSGLSREEKIEIAVKLKELKEKLQEVRVKEVVRVGASNDGTMQAQQQTETQAVRETQVELETQQQRSTILKDERNYSYAPWAEGLSLSKTFAPKSSGAMSASVPFRRVEHALKKSQDSHQSAISELFDKNLLVSMNFWHEGQRLYGSKAKPVHSYVVQMKEGDKGTKIFTATLVEETEAHAIEKKLKEGKEGDGDAKVALFNLDKGLVKAGGRAFTSEELCDPKLARLTAQIKLLSANFAYELSDAEANSLQSHPFLLGKEKNKERVFKFLEESVRSVDDVRTMENAQNRFREHLPRLLQILEKGVVQE